MTTATEPNEVIVYDGTTPLDNAQHELLCHEYLVDFNGHRAGVRTGYSEKTAFASVSRVLKDVNVSARLAYLRDQRVKRASKTGDDVIKELECIAFSRVGNVMNFNESGATFTHSPETLHDDDHAAIESIEVKEDHYGNGEGAILTTKIKMHPKLPALKELAKEHGVCRDKVDLAINGESLPEGITINFITAKGES